MSEEKQKTFKMVAFWMFSTVMIVFAAITAYIFLFTGGGMGTAIKAGFPIWGITALAAVIIFAVYYFFSMRQE